MATTEDIYTQLSQLIGNDNVNKVVSLTGLSTKTAIVIIAVTLLVISIWTLIWKGLALWKSARKSHKIWFIAILIINTVGILEILYIYVFSKINWNKKPITKQKSNMLSKKR